MKFLEKIIAYLIYLYSYTWLVFLVSRNIDVFFFRSGAAYVFISLAVIPIAANFTNIKQIMAVSIFTAIYLLGVTSLLFDYGVYGRYPPYVDYIGLSSCALVAFLFMRLIYKKGRKFGFFRQKSCE